MKFGLYDLCINVESCCAPKELGIIFVFVKLTASFTM